MDDKMMDVNEHHPNLHTEDVAYPGTTGQVRAYLDHGELWAAPSLEERIAVLLTHLREATALKGERRAVIEMRKAYSGYLKGLPGAARLRAALMVPTTIAQVAMPAALYWLSCTHTRNCWPMPPPPTKPITVDMRMLMSH